MAGNFVKKGRALMGDLADIIMPMDPRFKAQAKRMRRPAKKKPMPMPKKKKK